MRITKYPKASAEEINALKTLVKRVDQITPAVEAKQTPISSLAPNLAASPIPRPAQPLDFEGAPDKPLSPSAISQRKEKELFAGGIQHVEVTRQPLQCDNPIELLLMLKPEMVPYKWQFETLMLTAGYLTPGRYGPNDKSVITDTNPLKLVLPAANGSGKDMVIIASFAVWFSLIKARNRVIITSSSFDQTKSQTEPHIRELCNAFNKRFGPTFRSTQFHHIVPELGSEIKLFATDEAGKAEGFHPWHGGDMALVINEAKTVSEEIFGALSRCTGYSHWLEISSPGKRHGHMFRMVQDAIQYPAPAELGRFYYRRVTAYDCPHIPRVHIEAERKDKGESSPWFRSSILAEFSDFDEPVVISEYLFDQCFFNPPKPFGDDTAIGLDLAAGGDENAGFVRRGNRVIHEFFFRQPDTDLAATLIDEQLKPFKNSNYIFRADNGGVGRGIIDKLETLGWRISRTNNQSPAHNKREFLNLGAEIWAKVKRHIEAKRIILPNTHKLKGQLTTRYWAGDNSTQGKYALEPKPVAKASGRPSPDRADAFVLCFSSLSADVTQEQPKSNQKLITVQELIRLSHEGKIGSHMKRFTSNHSNGRFTDLTGKL